MEENSEQQGFVSKYFDNCRENFPQTLVVASSSGILSFIHTFERSTILLNRSHVDPVSNIAQYNLDESLILTAPRMHIELNA